MASIPPNHPNNPVSAAPLLASSEAATESPGTAPTPLFSGRIRHWTEEQRQYLRTLSSGLLGRSEKSPNHKPIIDQFLTRFPMDPAYNEKDIRISISIEISKLCQQYFREPSGPLGKPPTDSPAATIGTAYPTTYAGWPVSTPQYPAYPPMYAGWPPVVWYPGFSNANSLFFFNSTLQYPALNPATMEPLTPFLQQPFPPSSLAATTAPTAPPVSEQPPIIPLSSSLPPCSPDGIKGKSHCPPSLTTSEAATASSSIAPPLALLGRAKDWTPEQWTCLQEMARRPFDASSWTSKNHTPLVKELVQRFPINPQCPKATVEADIGMWISRVRSNSRRTPFTPRSNKGRHQVPPEKTSLPAKPLSFPHKAPEAGARQGQLPEHSLDLGKTAATDRSALSPASKPPGPEKHQKRTWPQPYQNIGSRVEKALLSNLSSTIRQLIQQGQSDEEMMQCIIQKNQGRHPCPPDQLLALIAAERANTMSSSSSATQTHHSLLSSHDKEAIPNEANSNDTPPTKKSKTNEEKESPSTSAINLIESDEEPEGRLYVDDQDGPYSP